METMATVVCHCGHRKENARAERLTGFNERDGDSKGLQAQ